MSETKESTVATCPICRSAQIKNALAIPDASIVRCTDCGFRFLHPQPSDEILRKIYSETYFLGATDQAMQAQVAGLKIATAELYLDQLAKRGIYGGRLLEVGCGDGYLLAAAERRGFDVIGVEYSEHAALRARAGLTRGQVWVGELSDLELQPETFDVCILADVIEHVREPRSFLVKVRQLIKPNGCALIATPSTDSWSAHLMRSSWMELKTEHMSYFNRATLKSLLVQTGFTSIKFLSGAKIVSLHYVKSHFEAYPAGFWTPLVRLIIGSLPGSLQTKALRISGSGILALAVKATSPS